MRKKFTRFISDTGEDPSFKRLSFFVTLHAILPAIIIIIILNLGQREAAKNTFENNIVQITNHITNSYKNELLKTKQLLTVLSALPEIQAQDKQTCEKIVRLIINSDPSKTYSNLGAVNQKGDNFCSALPLITPINLSNRANFITARATKRFVIGNFIMSGLNKKSIITLLQPILDEKDQFLGVTFASVGLAWFNRLAENTKLSPGYILTVIDKNGVIISHHPNSEKWLGKDTKNTELGKSIFSVNNTDGTFISIGLDKIKRLYAYSIISEIGEGKVYVVIGVPRTELTRFANQNLVRDVVLLLVVIFTAVLICAFDLHLILKKFKVTEVPLGSSS